MTDTTASSETPTTDTVNPPRPPVVIHRANKYAVSGVDCDTATHPGMVGTHNEARVTCRACNPDLPGAVVDSIIVRQESTNTFEPFKAVVLDLHDDGTVTWRDLR